MRHKLCSNNEVTNFSKSRRVLLFKSLASNVVLNRLANVNAFELHYKDRLLINRLLNVMEVYFNFKADGEENFELF